MIESEIVAAGSVEGVFSGKSYNRCVRAHIRVCLKLYTVFDSWHSTTH